MNTKNYSTLTRKFNLLISSMHALYRLTTVSLNQEGLIKRLSRLILQILNADFCSISILDETKKHCQIRAIAQKGGKCEVQKKRKINQKEELLTLRKESFVFKKYYLAAPLISEDVSGVIIIKKKGRSSVSFNATDRQILVTLSEQATIAINNSQLYEKQHKLILSNIKSLVSVLNTKSEHPYKHTACYQRIVLAIANKLRLDEQQIQSLYFASLLHDAGKIDIPFKILAKRRKLTGKEFDIIKTHPAKGAKIIKHLKGLEPAVPIVLHHHERFDGKGYPSGLKKKQIPIGARIMAVADAFEAVVFGRPYKQSLSVKQATEEISRNCNTQFDPKVVEAFLGVIKRKDLKNLIKKIRKEKFHANNH